MNNPRIQVFGQSHVQALREASQIRSLKSGENKETDITIQWLLKEKANGIQIGDVPLQISLQRAGELGPTDLLAVSILGTFHNAVGLLNHKHPFTVLSEDEKTAPEDIPETLIPHRVMRDIFKSRMIAKKLKNIRESTIAPIYHLAPPPPKKNSDVILDGIRSSRNRAARRSGIAPAPLRLKLWKMEMDVLSEVCREFDITLLPPPDQATDSKGYLRSLCYAPDATHANALYGELVLRQLENLVGQGPGVC
ncbi:hypothetical protein [Roseibium sp.]|uniref:hypothetical protein n=1 Tax=Roseibium sp. TaxID=1936156 RepID=UPI003A9829EB